MPSPKVLIIADNTESATVWEDALRRRSVTSTHIRFGAQTQDISLPDHFDLVVIDSHFESETALLICSIVRTKCDKPLLLLTYETSERYLLRAYEAGVEECVVRPVSVLLFLAKISVWLHRATIVREESGEVVASGFRADPKTRKMYTPDGREVRLSMLEFRLLCLFLANQGRVLETEFLLSRVWVHASPSDKRLLTNLVYRLRQKIESNAPQAKHIQLIAGQGYVWDAGDSVQHAMH
jgi:DNA-binding response OmpR family regulator